MQSSAKPVLPRLKTLKFPLPTIPHKVLYYAQVNWPLVLVMPPVQNDKPMTSPATKQTELNAKKLMGARVISTTDTISSVQRVKSISTTTNIVSGNPTLRLSTFSLATMLLSSSETWSVDISPPSIAPCSELTVELTCNTSLSILFCALRNFLLSVS